MRSNPMRAFRIALCLSSAIITGCDGSTSIISPPEAASLSQGSGSGAYSLTATATSFDAVALAWTDVSTNEIAYEVQRSTTGPTGSFALLAALGPNATAYSDRSVAATASYCYRVTYWRTTGRTTRYSEFSSVACATTRLAPPSNAHAVARSSTSATVTWTTGAGTAAGFHVERAASESGPWTAAATTSGTTTTFADAGRTPEQRVCYRVIGFTTTDDTSPSNAACVTPLAAPSDLAAATATDGIDLTWQDNSSAESYYSLEQSTNGVNFYLLGTTPGNTTTYHESGVSSGTRYWFRVRAQSGDASSDASNTADATGGCVPAGDEVCDNGRDDDCDGYTDGSDSDCGELVDCNANECGSGTICNGQYCVSSCHDAYRDSDESDVDCGGGCGSICQVGQHCWGSYDCASNICVYQPGAFQGVCQAPVSQP